jgi:hypothetical protein
MELATYSYMVYLTIYFYDHSLYMKAIYLSSLIIVTSQLTNIKF